MGAALHDSQALMPHLLVQVWVRVGKLCVYIVHCVLLGIALHDSQALVPHFLVHVRVCVCGGGCGLCALRY